MTEDFFVELMAGRFRWDLLQPFPRQSEPDRNAGDKAAGDLAAFVHDLLDPVLLDDDRRLPPRFFDELRAGDYLRLQVARRDGGLGLSDLNTFRAVSAAARVSGTAGFVLGIHNGLGLPALARVLPTGELRDLVLERLAAGAISAWADTEPAGAANDPATLAEPIGGGGYSLTGEKVFVSNGTVADELIVSAAAAGGGGSGGLFLVDTRSPGVRVGPAQELLGFNGLPLAAIRLDRVRVPAGRVLSPPVGDWRSAALFEPVSALGKIYLVSGAAMAIADACLEFQRDFARRRSVNGRALARYPAVQHLIAESAADAFAMDSVIRWCLLGDDTANLTRRERARRAAKNITTLACWRIVDRTMSLLAAEGTETARSKSRRGVPALPLERLFRDARILRITGGVDFAVDLWAAEAMFASCYAEPVDAAEIEDDLRPSAILSPRNQDHLVASAQETRRLARACLRLARAHPDRDRLLTQQHALIAAGRSVRELFGMAVVLARAAGHVGDDGEYAQALADVHCAASRRRLSELTPQLDGPVDGVHLQITEQWLYSSALPD